MSQTDRLSQGGVVLKDYLPRIDTEAYVRVVAEMGILRDVFSRERNHRARAFLLGELKIRQDEAQRQWQVQTAGFRNSPEHRREAYERIILLQNKIVDRCDVVMQASVDASSRWLKQLLWLMKTGMNYSVGALLDEDHETRKDLEKIQAMSFGQIASAQGIAVRQENLRQNWRSRFTSFFGRARDTVLRR